jgi:hypothetical protein
LAGAAVALGAPAAVAAPLPAILAYSVRPTALPASGGEITVSARLRGASTCAVEGLGVRHSLACRHARVAIRQQVPPNGGAGIAVYRVRLVASNGRRRAASAAIPVTVAANGPPLPSGSFHLYTCQPGPECDYGYSGTQFSPISNVLGEKLPGESAIDAAADWEYAVLHIRPEGRTLGSELEQAGGSALTLAGLIGYWQQRGIQGVRLEGATLVTLGKSTVLAKVRQYGILLAEFSIGQGWATPSTS